MESVFLIPSWDRFRAMAIEWVRRKPDFGFPRVKSTAYKEGGMDRRRRIGSGTWTVNTVENDIAPVTPCLVAIDGYPAVVYCDQNTATLTYAVNSLSSGLGDWTVRALASDCAAVGAWWRSAINPV
jgi:hypothetical protein